MSMYCSVLQCVLQYVAVRGEGRIGTLKRALHESFTRDMTH